ncbi:MAG: FIST N-terminal domain-containing protein [Planctomycetota bacterium]
MKLETLTWDARNGWSQQPFPALDGEQTLVLAFGSTEMIDQPAPIAALQKAYPRSHLTGCSTSGEIYQTKVMDHTLAVAIVRFEHTQLVSACTEVSKGTSSFDAAVALARQLLVPRLQSVLVLSDGLNVNGSELVRGMNSVLPSNVVVTGGLAGDGDRFQRTWVIESGTARSGSIAAVGFCGERLHVGHGSKGGWDIFGPERVVTRSRGNVLYELDHVPALQLYKKYLGDRAAGLPATALLFPLSVRTSTQDPRRLVRTILSIDEVEQSMTFAGDIPQGWNAQLMKANFDRLISGASDAALLTRNGNGTAATTLAIAVSCVGRRLVLGERAEEEVEATLEMLPDGTQQIGFYSYGEISPHGVGSCDLHNQTMTLTTIAEH